MELTNEFRVDVPVDQAWEVLTDLERIAPCMPGAQLLEVEGEDYRGVVKVKVGPITAQYKGVARFLEKDDAAKKAVIKADGRDTRGQGNANATVTASLAPDGDGTAVTVVTDLTVTGKVAQFGRGVLADVSSKLLNQFVECLHNDLLSSPAPAATAAEEEPAWSPAAAGPGAAQEAAKASRPEADPAPSRTSTATSTSNSSSRATGAANGSAGATGGGPATTTGTPPTTSPGASHRAGGDTVRKIDSKPVEPVDLLDAAGVPVAKRAIPVVAGVLVILWFLRRRRRSSGR